MGDPRKPRKQYSTPRHPWMKTRIDEEKQLKKEYGFKNKKELWKVSSILKGFFERAKKYGASTTEQSIKENQQLIEKLMNLNLVKSGATLNDVLSIQLRDLLDRRLQTLVFKKQLARSISQARQFITHGHIRIGEKSITSPSYLVTLKEEALLNFKETSPMNNEMHPERVNNLEKNTGSKEA